MDRKEVCAEIRRLNLQDAVKQHYGDNYTRVSTEKLEKLIMAYKPELTGDNNGKKKEEPKAAPKNNATSVDNPYEAACVTFLGLLKDTGLLEDLLKKL